jgi:hypothetical protein
MTDWEKFKITYLSKDLKTVRLNGDEYGASHLDMTKYQSQDLVEVQIDKGKIVAIRFPPGLEPSQPSKTEIEKQMVEEVAHKQEKQYHIVHIGNGKLIVSKGVEGDELCLTLKENALKFFKSFKAGDLVKWKYADNSTTDIVSLWKVNEDGSRPEKKNQFNGRPYDPEAEKRRQVLIVRQSCLDRAVTLYLARFTQADLREMSGSGHDHVASVTGIAEDMERWVMRE